MELARIEFTLVFKDGKCTIKSPLDYMKDGGFYPEVIVVAETDVYDYVISSNYHRLHLTTEQKRVAIAAAIKANPSKSNLAIGKQIKADDKTVASVRRELDQRSEIPNVSIVEDTKGRKQPAKKKRRDVDDHIREKTARLAPVRDADAPGPASLITPVEVITTTDAGKITSIAPIAASEPLDPVISIEDAEIANIAKTRAMIDELVMELKTVTDVPKLVRALKKVSRQTQELAQELEDRNSASTEAKEVGHVV